RRAVVGWDSARLSMLLAVLDTRAGLDFGRHDVFLNVAGGLRIAEPAADLAAAAALCSSLFDTPLPSQQVVFGEVALSGAIRPVNQTEARLKEAHKLGFSGALAPTGARGGPLPVREAGALADLIGWTRRQSVSG
ncbi:MAG: magnesium chelatase domain-containing protein, partial [Hyphococcus sp.]